MRPRRTEEEKAEAGAEEEPRAVRFESAAWSGVEGRWEPLFAGFHELGFSFEWHDFVVGKAFDWDASFHPDSLELCLNVSGTATFQGTDGERRMGAGSHALYAPEESALRAVRLPGVRHQFVTLELARTFLSEHLGGEPPDLDPVVRAFAEGDRKVPRIGRVERLLPRHLEWVRTLRTPPIPTGARRTWYECRALECIAEFCFAPATGELFCQRQIRLQRDRVGEVVAILKRRLAEPPSLEVVAKEVGVSPFYLSRIFSREMGMPMTQYLRRIRLERAAELLRSGEYNVTEAAFEVGYNSLSHFSAAFHEMFGVCPGLYPLGLRKGRASGGSGAVE